jgi:diguanylate cyclase (GGDEF)-like protein
MRDFAGRPISLPGLVAGTAFILLVTALAPAVRAYLPTRLAGFVVWIAYLSAAIFELSNRRMEPLRARWMLVVLCAAHAIAFIGGIVDALQGNLRVLGVPLALGSWYSLIHLDSLLYSMGTAVFLVVLCKERSEFNLQKAAGFDSLTGAMARGAFMAQAERLLARARKDGAPLAVVLVDLDRFKTINDTFGHRVGDHVLTVFADATRACLRPTDLFGRHGGEEFAILLPGAGIEEAFQIAERIRLRFIEVCGETGDGISATLSAGIAELGGDPNFEALLDKADKALYQAKNLGRNRIERAEPTDTQRPAISVAWPPKAAAG